MRGRPPGALATACLFAEFPTHDPRPMTPPLLSLANAGALNPAELEQVIERAMLQFDGRIALDDLRSMMEGAGFEDPNAAPDTQTVH